MKTLYVSDLDGTLLNRQEMISRKSINIINGLVEKGALFTYATARSFVSASVVTKGLSTNMPVIVYNGTLIINPSTREVLKSIRFTNVESADIASILRQQGILPLVYAYVSNEEKVSWLAGRENAGIRRYLDLRKNDQRLRPVQNESQLFLGDKFYFTCIGEKDDLMRAYDILSKDKRFYCTIQQELYRPEWWFEILPANATKAEAIKRLQDIYGCERIVSFGDAINDIPMFKISDECYAVSNAVDKLKAIATEVIGSNQEDGVAEWLNENVRITSL